MMSATTSTLMEYVHTRSDVQSSESTHPNTQSLTVGLRGDSGTVWGYSSLDLARLFIIIFRYMCKVSSAKSRSSDQFIVINRFASFASASPTERAAYETPSSPIDAVVYARLL